MKQIIILLIVIVNVCQVQAQTTKDMARQLLEKIGSSETTNIDADLNELLSLYRMNYSPQSTQYADALMWVAMVCAEAGDNKQSSLLLKQSDTLFAQYGNGVFDGRDTVQKILRCDLYSKILYNSGAVYRALQQAKKATQLKKKFFGQHSEIYLNALLDLSRLYAERLKLHKSNMYHNMGYDAYVERIKQEFCQSCESERASYWEKAAQYINKTIDLAHKSGSKAQREGRQSLAAAAYNAMLLS